MHTSNQFVNASSLIVTGLIGLILGGALFVRALDTGSWWQYLGSILLFTLSIRLFKKAYKLRK